MTQSKTVKKDMFKIVTSMMPTPEEHREVSLAWLKRIQPTLIDQWPSELLSLSMPTEMIRMPDGLFDEFMTLHDGEQPGPIMNGFAEEIDAALGWERKFIRLNSRSPKDCPWPFEIPITMSGKETLSILACSERALDDLLEFKYVPEQPAYICLRKQIYWLQGSNEFRCFVKDGQLIAVTHYDYTKPAPKYVVAHILEIRKRIDLYFTEQLKGVLPLETVVFDIGMNLNSDELLLIEINPYGLSDPCWFGSYENIENANSFIQTDKPEAPE